MAKEENATILEYLPNGYPLEKRRMMPVAQAVGTTNLTLLELVPRKSVVLERGETVYIGEGKRDKIYYILGRLPREKLTEPAKEELKEIIKTLVREDKKFVQFFNTADAINKRIHQIELLPGFGKKHMQEILKKRNEKEFESFEDMRARVANLPDPERAIEKRIFQELTEFERHNLFVR